MVQCSGVAMTPADSTMRELVELWVHQRIFLVLQDRKGPLSKFFAEWLGKILSYATGRVVLFLSFKSVHHEFDP